jgi:hypothetical protein
MRDATPSNAFCESMTAKRFTVLMEALLRAVVHPDYGNAGMSPSATRHIHVPIPGRATIMFCKDASKASSAPAGAMNSATRVAPVLEKRIRDRLIRMKIVAQALDALLADPGQGIDQALLVHRLVHLDAEGRNEIAEAIEFDGTYRHFPEAAALMSQLAQLQLDDASGEGDLRRLLAGFVLEVSDITPDVPPRSDLPETGNTWRPARKPFVSSSSMSPEGERGREECGPAGAERVLAGGYSLPRRTSP